MDIRKTYQELLQANLTLKDINQINDLKKQCRRENNQEFYYLSNLLIIDIYIEEKMYDEALKLAIEDLNKIDSSIFKNIYLYLLERIIYIYIQKGNYKSAYRYVYIKKNVIDLDNKEEVNRWYLEMSYVYAELNELNRALMYLQAILENYPSEEIKNIALSNMTKIYIDQGMIKEAKETLNQCLEGVLTANDEDGKLYCDYLLAKICILENNFQFAKQIYEELFKNQNQLPTEYLNLVNEYISLLIKMNELDEAEKIIKQYEKKFQEANIYIQKEFYKNKVKVASFKNSLVRDELNKILEMIDILDKEIASSKELVLYEAAEDEKNEEIQQSLKRTINKIEHTIDIITYALNQDDIRASLMNYSKRLEELLPYDEALFVIFEPKHYELMPNFFDHLSEFSSYQYKKDRLYERSHPYQSLTDTPIEIIMQNTNELIIDFTDTFVPLKNLITNRNYDSNTISSLVAIPFFHNKEIFGVVIYTSYNNLTTNENILILKIASKLLEFKLSSLFYQEDLRMQRNILQTAINRLHEGLFYLDPVNRKILLTEQFQKFLKTERRIISIEEYLTYIYPNDQKNYLETINQAFNRGEGYQIKYRIIINDEVNYVQEISNPYFLSNGTLSFFVGTINKIPYELTNEKIYLDENEFKQKISQLNQKITNL
ncbi:MAG TPA: PAS domain-containing protein, partial [Bacilli bacterium]|nr:PAS domain-containing protein [Bacilli bacterium]